MAISKVINNLLELPIPKREKQMLLENIKKGNMLDAEDIEMIADFVHDYVIKNNLHFNYFVLDLNNLDICLFTVERDETKISNNEMLVALPSEYSHLKDYYGF